jgi:HTH DNA binding domain
MAWWDIAMASDTRFAEPDEGDPQLRPAWEDTGDETDNDRVAWCTDARPAGEDFQTLLVPLCDATDALARLDARAAAAPEAVRTGLIARMANAEAAGWLAHAHTWVHPLDLALRDLDLTASTALAIVGGAVRSLPHTFAESGTGWLDAPFDAMADGDRAVADALTLARILRRLLGKTEASPFATAAGMVELLGSLGASDLDPARFAAWWSERATAVRQQHRAGKGARSSLPPLLAAAQATTAWMGCGIADHPAPVHAVLTAVGLLARTGTVRAVFVPVWAAHPAAGFGDRDGLPGLRSDVATRLVGRGQPITWTLTFLHLVAESARAGLRELDRLEAAAEKGRGLLASCDRRSRLPDAVEALLRVPVLTPKALSARLRIAPQTGTALLRALHETGLVREVTGRRSFRAFAI